MIAVKIALLSSLKYSKKAPVAQVFAAGDATPITKLGGKVGVESGAVRKSYSISIMVQYGKQSTIYNRFREMHDLFRRTAQLLSRYVPQHPYGPAFEKRTCIKTLN